MTKQQMIDAMLTNGWVTEKEAAILATEGDLCVQARYTYLEGSNAYQEAVAIGEDDPRCTGTGYSGWADDHQAQRWQGYLRGSLFADTEVW